MILPKNSISKISQEQRAKAEDLIGGIKNIGY